MHRIRAVADFDFNPRPHTGGDGANSFMIAFPCISIHAPTQGATSIVQKIDTDVPDFNPRPHTGGDHTERMI